MRLINIDKLLEFIKEIPPRYNPLDYVTEIIDAIKSAPIINSERDPATWNQLADEIRALKAENTMLRGRGKPERKLIYLASPFGGKESNHVKAQRTIMRFVETYPDLDFASPIISYGFCYDVYSYDRGIAQCLGLLSHCDGIYICYDDGISKGVAIERAYALQHGIPIVENAERLIGD